MNKINLSAVWNVARCEFVKWISNSRMILMGVILIFIRNYAVLPLLERAEQYGKPISVLEPFIAVCNSRTLVLLLPCAFLLLISDFPAVGGNTFFFISRAGKLNWFLGQIVFILLGSFTYIGVILAGCVLMSRGLFQSTWSDAITKFDAEYPELAGGLVSDLLPPNLYNQMPLLIAFVRITVLLVLYLFLLALILCLMKLLYYHSVGLFGAVTVIAIGAATCALKLPVMWYFPMANTIVWLHYQELLREPITPVWESFVYFIVILLVLFGMNLVALRRFQLMNVMQEGE